MKKRFLLFFTFLGLSMISNFISGLPFTLKNKVNVYFISSNSINLKDVENDISQTFCRNGIYFICDATNFSEVTGEYKKNETVVGNFRFYVYTKNNQIKYKINSIKVKTESDEFDIKDILYLPYPFKEPLQTVFTKDYQNPDYYISRYLLGYFKFSASHNEFVKIMVDIECEGETYNFVYDYTVKKKFSFITFND